jgi:hypothetical protein
MLFQNDSIVFLQDVVNEFLAEKDEKINSSSPGYRKNIVGSLWNNLSPISFVRKLVHISNMLLV